MASAASINELIDVLQTITTLATRSATGPIVRMPTPIGQRISHGFFARQFADFHRPAKIECHRIIVVVLARRQGTGPGVCPMAWNRAARRLSASRAFTGKTAEVHSARMRDVPRATADRAARPAIVNIEDQRRVHADGGMQAGRRLPGADNARPPRIRPACRSGCSGTRRPLQATTCRSPVMPRTLTCSRSTDEST